MRKLLAPLFLALALVTAVPVAQACALGDMVIKGSTDRSVALDIIDSTDGTPETGVVFNTSGIDLWYRREGAAVTSVTEVTLAALTTAHTDGGFLTISHGAYRFDLPDAAFATGANYVDIGGTVTGMVVICQRVRLVDTNIEVANTPANVIQWYTSDLGTGTGPLPGLGVLDRGTAQSDSTSTLQLRSAATFADSEPNGATALVYSATTGAGQRSSVASYVGSTDTATVSPVFPTDPTGTVRYELYAVSPAAGSVSIASGGIASTAFASGAIDAAAIAADAIGASELATDAIGAAEVAADAIGASELATDAIGTAELASGAITTAEFASGAIDAAAIATDAIGSAELATGAITTAEFASGAINAAAVATDAIGAAELAADAATENATAGLTAQGIITGTCSSGSTTTCVDAARTEADATQLQDRLICFSDGWCAMLTTFTPASDTATTTKVAPSTRASKTYIIFPSTAL